MTTQTPASTDNERLARLEGTVDQMSQRMTDMQTQSLAADTENNAAHESLRTALENHRAENNAAHESLRNHMYLGFGFIWTSMVAGFVAVFIAILNIS